METFKEWLKKEGLWLTDGNAEQTSGGVRAQKKSKPATPSPSGGGGGMSGGGMSLGTPPAAGGAGLSLPPK